jgi:hypothetical protein
MKRIILLIFLITVLIFPSAVVLGENHDIIFSQNDTVTQSIGVEIPVSFTSSTVSELKSLFGAQSVYIKLTNPTASVIQSSQFQELSQAGFQWYFLFTNNSSVEAAVNAFKSQNQLSNLVVELDEADAQFIQSLKAANSALRVHAGYLPIWPREQVKAIFDSVQPPTLEAVSFWMDIYSQNTFADIKLTFDTFFDATKDISGGSVQINYPANAVLSVSENKYNRYDQNRRSAYMLGAISSAIITSVQGDEAPIKYFIAGHEDLMSPQEKIMVAHFARMLKLNPSVAWPKAISANGDPWDNPVMSESNTKPIVGVIGKIPEGYYGFISNAGNGTETANFGSGLSLSSYKLYSTKRQQANSTSNSINLEPYETVIFYPSSFPDIVFDSSNIATPTQTTGNNPSPTVTEQVNPTPTPTQTVSCDQLKKQGNFNCTGGVDEGDFSAWKQDLTANKTSLLFFEYYRRTAFP